MPTKTIVHKIENWNEGIANGYYDFLTDEIHVLDGKSLFYKTLLHEEIHAVRKHTLTAKLGSLINFMPIRQVFTGFLLILGAYAIIVNIIPFLIVAAFYMAMFLCNFYEEAQANKATLKAIYGNQTKENHFLKLDDSEK
jgi:hypothetical protein